MQGLSLDDSLLPSLATAKVPVATLADPTDYGFDSQNVWDVPGALLPDAIGSLGGLVDATDPFLTQASQTAAETNQLRRSSAASSARTGKPTTTRRSSIPTATSPAGSPALAALLHAGFPIRALALQAPGEFDTHSDEAGPLADGLQQTRQALAAFQEDLEQRNLGSRVLTLPLERVRPTGGAELLERHRPRRRRRRVHDGRAAEAPHDRRVPGPRSSGGSTDNGNLKETVDFRAVYASLVEEWFGTSTPTRSSRTRRRCRGTRLSSEQRGCSSRHARLRIGARGRLGLPVARLRRQSQVQVVEKEYSLTLSRLRVRSGQRDDAARQLRHGQPRPRPPIEPEPEEALALQLAFARGHRDEDIHPCSGQVHALVLPPRTSSARNGRDAHRYLRGSAR